MFQEAKKELARIKIGISGTSGSGKTYSSLLIARGLAGENGKIALVDTENKSSCLYADLTKFDMVSMSPPFTVEKYKFAIAKAVELKYDVLIIDSLTHSWLELLAQKELMDSKGGNSYANWAKMSPINQSLIDSILQSDINIISTYRSKQDYVLQANDKGKMAPVKVGLAPVAREGSDYEYSIFFDMGSSHTCSVSKDRTGLFKDNIFVPSVDTGLLIRNYLTGEKPKE